MITPPLPGPLVDSTIKTRRYLSTLSVDNAGNTGPTFFVFLAPELVADARVANGPGGSKVVEVQNVNAVLHNIILSIEGVSAA